jgi:sortase family protein
VRSGSGPQPGSASLPAAVAGTTPDRTATGTPSIGAGSANLSAADRAALAEAVEADRLARRPGVPVAIDIPIRTDSHPDGVHARVTADRLNADQTLHVPDDPTVVSWAKQDAAPGSGRGTAILTSHVNYVINGRTVIGALSDLAVYAKNAIGKTFTLRMRDHRVFTYRIVAGREYTKDQLAGNRKLREILYDQSKVYGPSNKPSGRLLLVSCGGAFDEFTGEYEDNVFLYALPVA